MCFHQATFRLKSGGDNSTHGLKISTPLWVIDAESKLEYIFNERAPNVIRRAIENQIQWID
jgi:hypothetical protein